MKTKNIALSIITLALFVFCASAAMAATYYVAKDGNDNNDGLQDHPWLTIQKAAITLRPGDTAIIREGIYTEMVRPSFSGKSGSLITFKAQPGSKVTIDGENTEQYGLNLSDRSYIVLDGLEIIKTTWAGVFLYNSSNIIFKNSEIHNNKKNGIAISGSNYNTVADCRIHHNGNLGIWVHTSSADYENTFQNCKFYNNTLSGIFLGSRDSTISNCTSYQNGDHGFYVWGNNSVCEYSTAYNNQNAGFSLRMTGTKAIGNRVYDNAYGIHIWGTNNGDQGEYEPANSNIAFGNIVYNNKEYGISVYGDCTSPKIYNNTVYEGIDHPSIPFYAGHSSCGTPSSIDLKNNVFLGGSNAYYVLKITAESTLRFSEDYNCFYSLTGPTQINWSGQKLTFSNYVSTTGQGKNSMSKNPILKSIQPFDSTPQAGSPVIDSGTEVGYPYSGQAPDMGAIEGEGLSRPSPPKNVHIVN